MYTPNQQILNSTPTLSIKIVEKARHLFYTIGVRNTTMEDLAKELGISKKTLYKEIDNKADLVRFCVQNDLKNDEEAIKIISENTENAIEEMVLIAERINQELQAFHPSMIQDLVKFYPESWSLIEHHRDEFARKNIENNLKKGIKQGVYRKDINIDLVTFIQLHLSFFSLQVENKNIKSADMYLEVIKYCFHAIATPKGIELFNQLAKKNKN